MSDSVILEPLFTNYDRVSRIGYVNICINELGGCIQKANTTVVCVFTKRIAAYLEI